jgi:arylsulfatase A-like enzyme
MSRRRLLGATSAAGIGAALGPWVLGAERVRQRPNILYIMSDDHAAHALSCYGSRINKTPHLDRLAAGGMRLDNCFCTNSLCGPSRATLLTGKYSHAHGFRANSGRFDGSQQTFAKLLQKAGYYTAVIGKWHLASEPTGFDYSCVLPGQGAYVDPAFIEMGASRKTRGYVTDIITDMVIDQLKKRPGDKPFCMLYHPKAPHRSWQSDDKHARMYEDVEIPLPPTFDDDWATRGTAARDQQMTIEKHLGRGDVKADPPAGLSAPQLKRWKYQRFIKDYLRCVASLDDNIGRVLDFLDEAKLAQDTIVVYTSDNGFFLGDHGWYDKRFMYEHSLRVPMLVRWPGVTKEATASPDLAINCDFAPTFLDAAGVDAPADMHGRSLRGVLAGATPADWRTSAYYHYYEFPQPHHVHPHCGVRTRSHKLIHFHTLGEWELYDLEKDPHELKNVYADAAYAKVRAELEQELRRLQEQYKDNTAVPASRPH